MRVAARTVWGHGFLWWIRRWPVLGMELRAKIRGPGGGEGNWIWAKHARGGLEACALDSQSVEG